MSTLVAFEQDSGAFVADEQGNLPGGASPPTVDSVTPNSGPYTGGASVTIAGADFVDGATVDFDGEPATNVVVVDPTEITCDTPAHAAGAVDVVVTNPDSQSDTLADGFTYIGPRTMAGIGFGSFDTVFP